MRLNTFICENMDEILVQRENFASSLLPAAGNMTKLQLRDHAKEILEAIVKDISAPQTALAGIEKSKGLIQKLPGAPKTPAETHGMLRALSGFEIKQLASEYRALRASVLRLWLASCKSTSPHLEDVVRFSEAIDQALAESIDFFNDKMEERRNLFLGMLGHDMRTPLQAIQMTALVLKEISDGEKASKAVSRLIDNGSRMKSLLDELIDFNKIKLGLGVRITPTEQDMAELLGTELEQIRAAYPDKQLNLIAKGPTKGVWDGPSLRRVMGNLVVNAIKYGDQKSPITVKIVGFEDQMTFEVCNRGVPVDATILEGLFDPFKQGPETLNHSDGGLGLGLFISKQVVKAHGGAIKARCENGETFFAVHIPIVST